MGNLTNFLTNLFATQTTQLHQADPNVKPSEELAIGAFLSFFKDNIGSILVTSLIFFILFTGVLGMGSLNLVIAVPCAALTVYYAKSLLPYLGGAAAILGLAGAYFGWQGTAAANIAGRSVLPSTPATASAQSFTSPAASAPTSTSPINNAPQLPQAAQALAQPNNWVSEFTNQETDQLLEDTLKERKALENKNPPPSGSEAAFESAWNNNTSLAPPNHPWVSEYFNCELKKLGASIPKEQLKTYNEIWDSLQGPGFDIQNPASRQLLARKCQNQGLSWAQEFTNEKAAASFPWGKVATYTGGALMIAVFAYGGWEIYKKYTTETEEKEQENQGPVSENQQQSHNLGAKNTIHSVQQPTSREANTSLNRNGERLNTQEPTETAQNTSAAFRRLEILTKQVVLERISPTAQYLQQQDAAAPFTNHTTSTNIDPATRRLGMLAGHINRTSTQPHPSSSEITTVNTTVN